MAFVATRPPWLGSSSRGLHIGGSELLAAFFDEALRLGAAQIRILSAFAEASAFCDVAVRTPWRRLVGGADVRVCVRTRAAAVAIASSAPSSSLSIRIEPRLHAKVFVAWRAGSAVALIGSHNLTAAALHSNREAGLLIRAGTSVEHANLVEGLKSMADAVIREGTVFDWSLQ